MYKMRKKNVRKNEYKLFLEIYITTVISLQRRFFETLVYR